MGYSYDGLGRVASMTDFNGQTYRYGYNGNDKLTAVDGPLGYHVGYVFDANGNLARETDPNGGALKYSYDASENLTPLTINLTSAHILTYDAMNHLASETDAEGRVTTYARDTVYRVTESRAPERDDEVRLRQRRQRHPNDRSRRPRHERYLRCAEPPHRQRRQLHRGWAADRGHQRDHALGIRSGRQHQEADRWQQPRHAVRLRPAQPQGA